MRNLQREDNTASTNNEYNYNDYQQVSHEYSDDYQYERERLTDSYTEDLRD